MHNLNEDLYEERKKQIQPWLTTDDDYMGDEQKNIRELLQKKSNAIIASDAFIASDANIFTSNFNLGKKSWIASGSIIRGDVSIGSHCSINPNVHIAGKVAIGSGCRIASFASIYGFNHGHSRIDIYIKDQPATSEGVHLGDDVWVGANAVILDGATIGSHSIVAAGAVVTKSFPEYSIIAGNPAKKIKDRREYPLAKFKIKDRKSGIRYNFDMTFNCYVSIHNGVPIRGWILHPEIDSIIVRTQLSNKTLLLNKKRIDVAKAFFKDIQNHDAYVNCGFDYLLDPAELYSIYANKKNELIHIADISISDIVNEN